MLNATLLAMAALATTLRRIESDDPISLEELRAGLKIASTGLLAGARD